MWQAGKYVSALASEPPGSPWSTSARCWTSAAAADRTGVHVAGLIGRRLAEVEARLAELARARDQLAARAARAAAQDPAECSGYCSIIAG
jgi:hypothetical protein